MNCCGYSISRMRITALDTKHLFPLGYTSHHTNMARLLKDFKPTSITKLHCPADGLICPDCRTAVNVEIESNWKKRSRAFIAGQSKLEKREI
ncbi:hypothetical protein BgiBS90_002549 [Biomphalaria glabrata]|nr:hypothetical protein BgiBS90_002549 [Biomphalaria glabrata]